MTQTREPSLARGFDLAGLTAELRAHADHVDRERRAPSEGLAALRRRGLMGALIPAEHGGLGLSPAGLFEAADAVGAGCGATGLIWGQHLAATAMIARWGNPAARALLPAAARGERMFGIGVGHTSRPHGPVQARRERGRVLIDGAAPWVTGATVMSNALIAAEDGAGSGEVLMAVVEASALTVGAPYQLDVVTGGMSATVSFADVDVTDTLLDAPRNRAATGAVFTQNKAPRDAGFYTGLTRTALELCRDARGMDDAQREALARIDAAREQARAALHEWLASRHFDEVDQPAFWSRYHRTAQVMLEAAGLVMSAGGSAALREGATHNRLSREALYYLARIPFRSWVHETAAHLWRGAGEE